MWPTFALASVLLAASVAARLGYIERGIVPVFGRPRLNYDYAWWYKAGVSSYVVILFGAPICGIVRLVTKQPCLVWPSMLVVGVIMALAPEQSLNGILISLCAGVWGGFVRPFIHWTFDLDKPRGTRFLRS
jgi:hypothetical protein